MTELSQLNWNRTNLENIEKAWDGDLWDRERLGVQLTNYVDRLQCGAVLALDARWGEGKTWFVRHWQKHLEDEKHNVIYLNAFANDYLEDPFLVIASEIAAKLDKTADKRLVYQFKKASAVIQQGLLTLAPTLIASMISCAITGGIIPFIKIDSEHIKDKIDDAIDKVTDNIGEKVTEAIQNKIDNYEEEKKSLLAFKGTLSELADSLDKPLVFVIDELDRCRPDFAIRLIERVKHFFDIPKIVFVLVMNKNQFIMGVKYSYGYDDESSKLYLEKFIDFEIPLINSTNINSKNIVSFNIVKELMLQVGEDSNDIHLVFHLALENNISFRELKKKINIYALLKKDSEHKNLFIALSIIKRNNLIGAMKNVVLSILKFQDGHKNILNVNFRSLNNGIVVNLVEANYNLELSTLLECIDDFRLIEIESYQNNPEGYKLLFSKIMNKYALKPTEKLEAHIFERQFIKYLNSSL